MAQRRQSQFFSEFSYTNSVYGSDQNSETSIASIDALGPSSVRPNGE